ncbi:MAG: glycosyltransferase family 2 protein [Bacteroidetes bacterium]|nr:glycosyltransferase family 2 protein [Bacteroidota bacterium]
MKVTGFTFIRNAVKFDYPIVEAITSILPICDEFIVAVGNSEDETQQLIEQIASPKIHIINTVWNDELREGGNVLAEETNKAFDAISNDTDWAFYIQGDEVIHEQYLPEIQHSMKRWLYHKDVEGLVFDYLHFYGSYDFIGDSRRWYRKEVRIVRNNKKIRSYRDAQGFRIEGRKLKVKQIAAWVYHYGWVKPPEKQQLKQLHFNRYWDKSLPDGDKTLVIEPFDYSQTDSVAWFKGTHPKVIQQRINKMNWEFGFDPTQRNLTLKSRLLHWIEDKSGWRVGEYKNYKII